MREIERIIMKKSTQIVLIIVMVLFAVSVFAAQYYKVTYYHSNVAKNGISNRSVALPSKCGKVLKLYVDDVTSNSGTFSFALYGAMHKDRPNSTFEIYPGVTNQAYLKDDVPFWYSVESRTVKSILTNTGETTTDFGVDLLIEPLSCASTSGW